MNLVAAIRFYMHNRYEIIFRFGILDVAMLQSKTTNNNDTRRHNDKEKKNEKLKSNDTHKTYEQTKRK